MSCRRGSGVQIGRWLEPGQHLIKKAITGDLLNRFGFGGLHLLGVALWRKPV